MATPKKQEQVQAKQVEDLRTTHAPNDTVPHRVVYGVDVHSYDTRTAEEIREAREAEEDATDE